MTQTTTTPAQFTPEQIRGAVEVRDAINAREDIANRPTLLPIVSVEKVPSKDGKSFRFQITAEGFAFPIVVWDRQAEAMAKAFTDAPTNNKGQKVVPVIVSATTSPVEVIAGVRVGGYYNVQARPAAPVNGNPFKF